MHIMKVFLAVVGVGTFSGPLSAAPIYYDCDTASDKFSEVKWPATTLGLVVTGKIVPVLFRKGQFLPVANLHLRSGDGKNYLAIRLIAESVGSNDVKVLLESVNNGIKKEGILGQLKRLEVLPFAISYAAGDQLTLMINNRKYDVEVALGNSSSISMTCSTGQFKFQDIDTTAQ